MCAGPDKPQQAKPQPAPSADAALAAADALSRRRGATAASRDPLLSGRLGAGGGGGAVLLGGT